MSLQITTANEVRSQQGRQYRYMTHVRTVSLLVVYTRAACTAANQRALALQSWLVSLYLDCPPGLGLDCPNATAVAAFEDAVRRGDVYWHAYPFNMQSEVADASLLAAAVSLTHDLDSRFGLPPKITVSQAGTRCHGRIHACCPCMLHACRWHACRPMQLLEGCTRAEGCAWADAERHPCPERRRRARNLYRRQ